MVLEVVLEVFLEVSYILKTSGKLLEAAIKSMRPVRSRTLSYEIAQTRAKPL